MLDVTLITDTADPAELYATYVEVSARYDQANDQLNELRAEFDRIEDEVEEEDRQAKLAELDQLGAGHSILLGWVSVYFAAYTFALRGTETPWLDARTTVRFVGTDRKLRPLAPVRSKGRRR